MYYREDGRRLKTKIIATIGTEGRTLFDPDGNACSDVGYQTLIPWFEQPGRDCVMVDVLRLNMAFYSADQQEEPYKRIFNWLKQEENGLAKNLGILCDLAGAKTRLGEIQGGKAILRKGRDFKLLLKDNSPGNRDGASVLAYGQPLITLSQYSMIMARLRDRLGPGKPGLMVSLGDGKTTLKVIDEKHGILECKVEKEGVIKSNWGITFEGVDLGLPSFQRPDQEALKFLLGSQCDNDQGFISFIGVSFVREARDILNVRGFVEDYFVQELGYSAEDARLRCPNIIAKIETAQGANNIEEILDVADGAMVARGDLALQLGLEEVPGRQKEIISLCNKRGKIVITATEMLASMEDNPKPTRAEVNDVFNAIMDGTDAVMLSGETASGRYPAQAVNYMARIAERAETYYEKIYARKSPLNTQRIQEMRRGSEDLIKDTNKRLREKIRKARDQRFAWEENLYREKLQKSQYQGTTDRICAAACELAEEEEFKAIVASTASGRTVRMISRFRPSVDLIGIIYDDKCRRKLLLSYGACPFSIGESSPSTGTAWQEPEEVFKKAAAECLKSKLSKKGDHVIFVSGTPLGKYGQGKVNILKIKEIQQPTKRAATAEFPMIAVTVEEAALDEVLKVAAKLTRQAQEYGVELKVEYKKNSPVEVIITILEHIERDPLLSALIWALIVGFSLKIIGHTIEKRTRKNLQMATIQAWHYLKQDAKVNIRHLTLERSDQRVTGDFWLVFTGDGKWHRLAISEGCQVKKYSTKEV